MKGDLTEGYETDSSLLLYRSPSSPILRLPLSLSNHKIIASPNISTKSYQDYIYQPEHFTQETFHSFILNSGPPNNSK